MASRRLSTKVSACSLRSRLDMRSRSAIEAAVDDGDVAAERFRFFEVVRGEDDRGAARVDLAQELPHGAADLDVDAGGGLVEDQQARLVHQRARDHEAALHAARQAARHLVALVRELQQRKIFLRALAREAALDAVEARLVHQDGLRRLELVEIDLLRHDADAGLGGLELAVDVVAEHAARCRRSCSPAK